MFSYKTNIHEGTRFTPHEFVFGKIARLTASDPLLVDEMDRTYLEYHMSLINKINRTQEATRRHLMRSKQTFKRHYEKKTHPISWNTLPR